MECRFRYHWCLCGGDGTSCAEPALQVGLPGPFSTSAARSASRILSSSVRALLQPHAVETSTAAARRAASVLGERSEDIVALLEKVTQRHASSLSTDLPVLNAQRLASDILLHPRAGMPHTWQAAQSAASVAWDRMESRAVPSSLNAKAGPKGVGRASESQDLRLTGCKRKACGVENGDIEVSRDSSRGSSEISLPTDRDASRTSALVPFGAAQLNIRCGARGCNRASSLLARKPGDPDRAACHDKEDSTVLFTAGDSTEAGGADRSGDARSGGNSIPLADNSGASPPSLRERRRGECLSTDIAERQDTDITGHRETDLPNGGARGYDSVVSSPRHEQDEISSHGAMPRVSQNGPSPGVRSAVEFVALPKITHRRPADTPDHAEIDETRHPQAHPREEPQCCSTPVPQSGGSGASMSTVEDESKGFASAGGGQIPEVVLSSMERRSSAAGGPFSDVEVAVVFDRSSSAKGTGDLRRQGSQAASRASSGDDIGSDLASGHVQREATSPSSADFSQQLKNESAHANSARELYKSAKRARRAQTTGSRSTLSKQKRAPSPVSRATSHGSCDANGRALSSNHSASSGGRSGKPMKSGECDICGPTSTPMWRRVAPAFLEGEKLNCCNACGVKLMRGRIGEDHVRERLNARRTASGKAASSATVASTTGSEARGRTLLGSSRARRVVADAGQPNGGEAKHG